MNETTENIDLLYECSRYFKSNIGYNRIFEKMKSKLKRNGKLSGYIVIDNPSDEEKTAIKLILCKNFNNNQIKFKIEEFQKSLKESKYSKIDIYDLLQLYFGENILTNKSIKQNIELSKAEFFISISEKLKSESEYTQTIEDWLNSVKAERSFGHRLIINEIYPDKNIDIVINVCKAINFILRLGNEKIRLAILSAKITTDPHYFDKNNIAGKLFIHILSYIKKCEFPKTSENCLLLYYDFGIIPDSISSYTTAYGISLYTTAGIHRAYQEFINQNEEYIITISNLNRVINADCKSKRVYVVENQTVFSQLCENLNGKDISIICTSGQMKVASLILIDMLCSSNCEIFYSGDIDPEGLIIADMIVKRGNGKVKLWHFETDDYINSMSKKKIVESSLKKLEKLENPKLKKLANEIIKTKYAGYQELILDKLQKDIIKELK